MELQMILENAVLSIESLKDYYCSQIDKLQKEIDKKINKYLPGVALEHYMFAKAANRTDILNSEMGIKLTKMAEEILVDFSFEKQGDIYTLSYQLNENSCMNKNYEIDPKKASYEYKKLNERIEIFNNSTLMSLIIKYEETMAQIFKYAISKYPSAYLNNKSLTYTEILEIDSKIENIKDTLLEREVDDIMRSALSEWYKLLTDKHKITFDNLNDYFDDFKEIYYRRNIVVHNNGVVNASYLNGVSQRYREQVQKGERLLVNKEYLSKTFELTYIIIYGTFLNMGVLNKDSNSLYQTLNYFAFDHMIKGEWKISNYIYQNIMKVKTKTTSSIDIEMRKINYWISLKNMHGLEMIRNEIDEYDVSAMEGEFKIAKACLLNNYKEISGLLEIYLNTRINTQEIESWPLFIQYRKSTEYKKFKKLHINEFEKQVYKTKENKQNDVDKEIVNNSDIMSR